MIQTLVPVPGYMYDIEYPTAAAFDTTAGHQLDSLFAHMRDSFRLDAPARRYH
jgi:hypothetical protein